MLRRLLMSLSARGRRQPAHPLPNLRQPLAAVALRSCGLLLCGLVLTGCAAFGGGDAKTNLEKREDQTAEDTQPKAFTLVVEAPDDIRELLTKHLDLQRYSQLSDLNASELARLLVMADENARNLIATLGYFSPTIEINREASESATETAEATAATPTTASESQTSLAVPVVRMKVTPGPQTHVRQVQVDFAGDIATNPSPEVTEQQQRIRSDWRLPVNKPFTQSDWSSAKSAALRELTGRRYLAGRISESSADIDPEAREAKLGITLESGPEYRLGPMVVTGLTQFPETTAERFAQLKPGGVYDRGELLKAQQRLTDSGYFDSAFLLVDPNADPNAAPVQTQLREAKLQKLVLGIGVSTDSGPRASVEHTHNRVPYMDWRATSKITVDQRNQYIGSELTSLPNENYWRWLAGGHIQREVDAPLVTTSEQLRAGRLRTTERLDRSVYLQYDRARVTGGDATVDDSINSSFTLTWGWTTRKFDNVVFPTSGWGLGVEFGPGVTLGSQTKPFLRGLLRGQAYLPLSTKQGRIALRGQAGAVVADAEAPVPSTQQFLTGGDTTVRGYGYRNIGVPTATGLVEAGRYMTVASVEWQRPITIDGRASEWESAVFVDSGAVADSAGNLSPQTGVGVGARWRSPVGPLQVDLAYGVEAKQVRLHLSVGFTF